MKQFFGSNLFGLTVGLLIMALAFLAAYDVAYDGDNPLSGSQIFSLATAIVYFCCASVVLAGVLDCWIENKEDDQ